MGMALVLLASVGADEKVAFSFWAVQAVKEDAKPVDREDQIRTAQPDRRGAPPPGLGIGLVPQDRGAAPRGAAGPRREKTYDTGLEPIRSVLASLPYDTYTHVASKRTELGVGDEQRIVINDRYTFFAEPQSIEPDGRVRMAVRVEMKRDDGRSTTALDTTILLAPGKKVNLGGFKLDKGDLLMVLVTAG
jgi:hypothetical protein